MEDVSMVSHETSMDLTQPREDVTFLAVFDGHGGSEAAFFAKKHLFEEIKKQKAFWSTDVEQVKKAISDGFLATHKLMWKSLASWPKTASGQPSTAGTTASVVIIKDQRLYVAHVGDSGVVVGQKTEDEEEESLKAYCLTVDHKPDSPEEKARIEASGGQVMSKSGVQRVVWHRPRSQHKGPVRRSTPIDCIPFLAVARALGDLWSYNTRHDSFVVSPEPDVEVYKLSPGKNRCLLIASDGLWNMLRPQEAISYIDRAPSAYETQDPSRSLVDYALWKWSARNLRADNTTAIVVWLEDAPKSIMPAGVYASRASSTSTIAVEDLEDLDIGDEGTEKVTDSFERCAAVFEVDMPRTPKNKVKLHRTPMSAPSRFTTTVRVEPGDIVRYPSAHLMGGAGKPAAHMLGQGSSSYPSPRHHLTGTPKELCSTPLLVSKKRNNMSPASSPAFTALRRSKPDIIKITPLQACTRLSSPAKRKLSASSEESESPMKRRKSSKVGMTSSPTPSGSKVFHESPSVRSARATPQSPRPATSAHSPLKVDTCAPTASAAPLVSPLWPSSLDHDLDVPTAPCGSTPAGPEGLCSSVLRENSPKTNLAPVGPHGKAKGTSSSLALRRKQASGSQNRVNRLVVMRKTSRSQGCRLNVTVKAMATRTRSQRPMRLRGNIHRTRFSVRATHRKN